MNLSPEARKGVLVILSVAAVASFVALVVGCLVGFAIGMDAR